METKLIDEVFISSAGMKILILSRSTVLYSTQSLVNATRRRHHAVKVVDHLHCNLSILNGRLGVRYQGSFLGRPDAVIPRIGSSVTSYGAAVVRHFELMGVYTVVSTEALLRSRDKRSALQYLAAHNIPVPDTVFMATSENVDTALDVLGKEYPVIIKMLQSTQGDGVLLGENKQSSIAMATSFLRIKEEILLQRFIRESNGKDIRVFVVGGEVVATMERSAQPGEFRSNLHRGGDARKVKITAEEKDIAIRAADLMGLKVAGVDLLRSKEGPVVLEVNASPGLEGIERATKVDIAGYIIKLIEDNAGS